MTLTLTPWARAAIPPDDLAALRARLPAGHELRIAGRGRDWSAYLVTRQGCLASVQHAASWQVAVDAVFPDDTVPDDWTEDEDGFLVAPLDNREGLPEFNGAFDKW